MKNTVLSLMVLMVSVAGCSLIYDFYPAQIPKDTEAYANTDPNQSYWPGIGRLKELREQCITKNIITQIDLSSQISLDKALYDRAIAQANINIEQAQAERDQIVGTIQNPGWLLSFLLPATGALAGRAITKLTHYSEAELKTELAKVNALTAVKPTA